MKDPVFMQEEETLEQVYQRMREHNLSGVPVVDKNYHIKGFITLLGLMAVCFPDRD
jgi:CBS domain-containing protein